MGLRCTVHGTPLAEGAACPDCPPREPIDLEAEGWLFVVVSVADRAPTPAKPCDGCLREIPKGERFIEYSDGEYFPAFCKGCVERMLAALNP